MNFTRYFKNRCSENKLKITQQENDDVSHKIKLTVTQVAVMYLIGETGGW